MSLAVRSTLVDIHSSVDPMDLQYAGLIPGNSHLVDAERMASLHDRRTLGHVVLGDSSRIYPGSLY